MKAKLRNRTVLLILTVLFITVSISLAVDTVYSRAADWDAAGNKFVSGTNFHGTFEDPNGGPSDANTSWWSYHYYGANAAVVGYDANSLPDPTVWYDLNNLPSSYGNFSPEPLYDHDYVDRAYWEFLWHSGNRPDTSLRPSWIMSSRHYPQDAVISLAGEIIWNFSDINPYDGGSYACSIGVVSASGDTYTALYEDVFEDPNMWFGTTLTIAELADIPELQDIRINAGERLVIAFRGAVFNWRRTQYFDGDVTITDYDGCAKLPGDTNGDCKVDFLDYAEMIQNWMQSTN